MSDIFVGTLFYKLCYQWQNFRNSVYPKEAMSQASNCVSDHFNDNHNSIKCAVGTAQRILTRWISLLLVTTAISAHAQQLDLRIILIGDSTMAPLNGYGEVLCEGLSGKAECWNLAKNGRSSKSFRAEGLWSSALEEARKSRPVKSQWMLIQFGHNDQPGKPGRSTDLATEYPANLAQYIHEARAAGLNPILVTPLIRRDFRGGEHIDDLAPWASAMKSVAERLNVPLIDLHASSRAKVRTVGEAEANRYAVAPPGSPAFDRTHLGPLGACTFAELVLGQLPRVTEGQIQPETPVKCVSSATDSIADKR
jgi:lysophospholipase L1-like esterase